MNYKFITRINFDCRCTKDKLKMVCKFITDDVFITIEDFSDEKVDNCLEMKIIYKIEDTSGNLYYRELGLDSLDSLHSIFRMDPYIFTVLIKMKPTTLKLDDSIICRYKFEILGRMQTLDLSVPLKLSIPEFNKDHMKLQKIIQEMKSEMDVMKTVIKSLSKNVLDSEYFSEMHQKILKFDNPSHYAKMNNLSLHFTEIQLKILKFTGFLDRKWPRTEEDGWSFLHDAMYCNHEVDIVNKDLFDIDTIAKDGKTALYEFRPENSHNLPEQIIKAGANLEIKNHMHHTVLYHTILHHGCHGSVHIKVITFINLLLENGANVNVYDIYGKHLLQLSLNPLVRELLLKYGANIH